MGRYNRDGVILSLGKAECSSITDGRDQDKDADWLKKPCVVSHAIMRPF